SQARLDQRLPEAVQVRESYASEWLVCVIQKPFGVTLIAASCVRTALFLEPKSNDLCIACGYHNRPYGMLRHPCIPQTRRAKGDLNERCLEDWGNYPRRIIPFD